MKTVANLLDLLTSIGGNPGDDLVTQSRDSGGERAVHFDSSAQHTVGDNVPIAEVGVTKGPSCSSPQSHRAYGGRHRDRDPEIVPVMSAPRTVVAAMFTARMGGRR
ncbi:hypothetical protein Axi01nite_56770 [Actinoplanes xinjiangensis]|nr:hypothetical protein Axi01nite_56770 [Actinoplanes xinjiangensis]